MVTWPSLQIDRDENIYRILDYFATYYIGISATVVTHGNEETGRGVCLCLTKPSMNGVNIPTELPSSSVSMERI